MVGPSAGLDDFAVRGTPEGFHAVEGLDELLAILKGHTEQAGGEAVGCAGVGGEDAHAVNVAGGPEGIRVDEVMVAPPLFCLLQSDIITPVCILIHITKC